MKFNISSFNINEFTIEAIQEKTFVYGTFKHPIEVGTAGNMDLKDIHFRVFDFDFLDMKANIMFYNPIQSSIPYLIEHYELSLVTHADDDLLSHEIKYFTLNSKIKAEAKT